MDPLGKPIGGIVGHTVPMDGFDQGEHGAGTGVSGGHVPSATNQAKGYGQDTGFNAGLGGEHASGGLPPHQSTPIADKFMGSNSQGHSTSDTVSGAYAGGGTSDALTGKSNAHTTGAGVGPLAENLQGPHHSTTHGQGTHGSHATHGAASGAYDGTNNRGAATGDNHSHSTRDAALTGTAGAAAATALGSKHGHEHSSGTGVGPSGGSGGHYSQSQTSGSQDQNYNVGTGTGAGVLAGQQAGARGTHGSSGIAAGAGAVGAGAAAGSGIHSGDNIDSDNSRGEPLSNPKDLDSGTRHGLVFDKATGKYVHRHELDEKK